MPQYLDFFSDDVQTGIGGLLLLAAHQGLVFLSSDHPGGRYTRR
ncbi:hypothetical protein AB0O18_31395 [Streptomyces sp. NPDC093224]